MYAALRRGEDVRRSPTGETVSEVGERVAQALVEITAAAPDGATVVATTHGLAGRAGMCRLLGLPFEHWRSFGSLDNCAWAVLHRHRAGGYWRVAEYDVQAPVTTRSTAPSCERRFRDVADRLVVCRGSRSGVEDPAAHPRGALAQLVARFHGMEEVRGSNPLSSTSKRPSQRLFRNRTPG